MLPDNFPPVQPAPKPDWQLILELSVLAALREIHALAEHYRRRNGQRTRVDWLERRAS